MSPRAGKNTETTELQGTESPQPQSSRLKLLVIGDGELVTHMLPSEGDVVIGRSEKCEVRIDHASISRRHAVLHIGDPLTIRDLESKNGTRVRQRALEPGHAAAIEVGETFGAGSVTLAVMRAVDEAQAAIAPSIVVADPAMRRLYELLQRIAAGDVNVMVLGETGVGKEVIARKIHELSPRAGKAYVGLNCSALAETLFESELFGYERGAFTGAVQAKAGLLETAEGGTVLLDEVGELSPNLQAKLLRVIEEREVRRVGSVKARSIDVRFISATNRDLENETARGQFRQDLLYRLNGVSVTVPPLRERSTEIEPLAKSLVAEACRRFHRRIEPSITPEALSLLTEYRWPGNIRELRNVIERIVVLESGETVLPEHLPKEILNRLLADPSGTAGASTDARVRLPDAGLSLDDLERDLISQALLKARGNKTLAAKLLGLTYDSLRYQIKKFGLE